MRKPTRYFVGWKSDAKVAALVAKHGEDLSDTDPADMYEQTDFRDIERARAFARKVGGSVMERAAIEQVGPNLWDWETEVLV